MSFICHIHNYTEYNQQWNVFSAFNPSTHTWISGQPTLRHPGSSWRFGALLKGLTKVVDNSCWSQVSNPQPRITSPTLYPLGHDFPYNIWRNQLYGLRTCILARNNNFKFYVLIVDYWDVFISCLGSFWQHPFTAHGSIGEQVMYFSKYVTRKKQTHLYFMAL